MKSLTLRQTYLYLVSFVALMILVTGMIRSVMAAADFFMPGSYYIPGPAEIYSRYRGSDGKEIAPIEVIEEQIEFETARAKAQVRSSAYHELKRGLSYVAVSLPVWLYHWRRIQAENRPSGETSSSDMPT